MSIINCNTYFHRWLMVWNEVVKLILFLSKKSPRGRRFDRRSSRNFCKKENRASLAIDVAAAPIVCAVSFERSGVDMLLLFYSSWNYYKEEKEKISKTFFWAYKKREIERDKMTREKDKIGSPKLQSLANFKNEKSRGHARYPMSCMLC